MTILNLYQLDPKLAAKVREVIEAAMNSSAPAKKRKLRDVLRQLDQAYESWDDIEEEEPVIAPDKVEPFDPFDL
jgi:hypothetical protein